MLGGAVWSQLVFATVTFRASDWQAWIAVAFEAAGLAAVVRAVRRSTPAPLRELRLDAASGAFLTVGLLYLGAIVVLRWRNQFDPYDFRLLGPGSVLVEIGLLRLALTSWPAARRTVAATALALAALSLAFALAALPRPWQPRYAEAVAAIRQRYAALPPGAIVVFGSGHLHYLRPDLFVAMPLCPPWFVEHETWAQFVGRLDHAHPIFVDMRQPPLDLRACDASIRRAVTGYPAGAVTPLVASAG